MPDQGNLNAPLNGSEGRSKKYAGCCYRVLIVLLVVGVVLLACVHWLHPVDKNTPQFRNKFASSTLIVMRHCARGCNERGAIKMVINGSFKFKNVNEFAPRPWPNQGVSEAMACLPRGAELIEAQGNFLKQSGGLPAPVRSLADTPSRDTVTRARFLKGLGLGNGGAVNNPVFIQRGSPLCERNWPSMTQMMDSAHRHSQANSPPPGYYEAMHELYELIGEGSVGDWTKNSCTQHSLGRHHIPFPAGNCNAASVLWEFFMMQWAGGKQIGWGLFDKSKVIQFNKLHSYWMWLLWGVPDMYKYMGPSFARFVADRVLVAEEGTDLLVGHDTNMIMLKGALGLSWEPEPYAGNATLPGSLLRFDRHGTKVKASYWFLKDFSNTDGVMESVPARFALTGSEIIGIEEFYQLLMHGSSSQCSIRVDGIPLVPDLDALTVEESDDSPTSADVPNFV